MSIEQMRLFIAIFLDLLAKSCYDIRANLIWRCIEVVVTRTTRNRFVLSRARGFESHHLRQAKRLPLSLTKATFLNDVCLRQMMRDFVR